MRVCVEDIDRTRQWPEGTIPLSSDSEYAVAQGHRAPEVVVIIGVISGQTGELLASGRIEKEDHTATNPLVINEILRERGADGDAPVVNRDRCPKPAADRSIIRNKLDDELAGGLLVSVNRPKAGPQFKVILGADDHILLIEGDVFHEGGARVLKIRVEGMFLGDLLGLNRWGHRGGEAEPEYDFVSLLAAVLGINYDE